MDQAVFWYGKIGWIHGFKIILQMGQFGMPLMRCGLTICIPKKLPVLLLKKSFIGFPMGKTILLQNTQQEQAHPQSTIF